MPLVFATTLQGIARLQIDHIPNRISVRAALRPHDVDTRATQTIETRDPAIVASIIDAIEHTGSISAPSGADLRYAVRLYDARGRLRCIVYLDAFGLRAVIDAKPVRFANDAVKRAIVAAFPSLAQ